MSDKTLDYFSFSWFYYFIIIIVSLLRTDIRSHTTNACNNAVTINNTAQSQLCISVLQ